MNDDLPAGCIAVIINNLKCPLIRSIRRLMSTSETLGRQVTVVGPAPSCSCCVVIEGEVVEIRKTRGCADLRTPITINRANLKRIDGFDEKQDEEVKDKEKETA